MFERKVTLYQEEVFEGVEAARQYAETAKKSTRRYLAFLERLETLGLEEGRCLDVGAGPGILTSLVAQKFPQAEITALELSPDMVLVGQDYAKSQGLQDRIDFVTGDAAHAELVQSLGKFDLIFSTYTLHHWDNPRQVIDNLIGSLADDGLLYLYDLRRVWWLYWVPIKNGFFQSIRGAYVKSEIEELLQGLRPGCYQIEKEFPFMYSILIRQPAV